MALSSLPPLPPGFTDLHTAYQTLDVFYNIFGVCVDFLEATKSKGSDMTIKFTLHDPRWIYGLGLEFRFFHKDLEGLPKITNQGDVIVLRNVKMTERFGQRFGWSNSTTTWSVLEYASISEGSCPHGSDITIHHSKTGNRMITALNPVEIDYAKRILQLENTMSWPMPARSTSLQIANTMTQAGGTAPSLKERYRQISDIAPPETHNGYVFVDVFGEVRKIYDADFRVELSITDYTENKYLYNQTKNDDYGYDGDQYGYVSAPTRKWPGPWGKMTMDICLWDAHASFARAEVKAGQFVSVRNVHVKFDRNGVKLEGHCRGDRLYPEKVNVSIFKPSEAQGNERFKSLLRRKREYEAKAKASGLPFDPQINMNTKKNIKDSLDSNKERDSDRDADKQTVPKTKRNRDRKNRRRAQAKAEEVDASADSKTIITTTKTQNLTLNTHVRCNNIDIPLTTIASILDPATLKRNTPSGNLYSLPFQNACYKSKVRVIDYFPDDVADFAAPVRKSEYNVLSDEESDNDVDEDTLMRISTYPNGSIAESESNEIKWEWRFFLLVEDARPGPLPNTNDNKSAQIPLLVAGQDGEFLLKTNACDLRHPSNTTELAKLKEKLFVLWGDLAERKEEVKSTAERMEITSGKVKPSARPFECFIKEYGIKRRKDVDLVESGDEIMDDDDEEYERMFGLCYTSI